MHINIYEIIAVFISTISVIYGIVFLSKRQLFNRVYLYAACCYLLEELWVIVNSLFGHIEGLVTIRLFGIFGTFSFFLTAGIIEINDINNKDIVIEIKSLILPFLFLILYFINIVNIYTENIVLGLVLLLPMILASYFNLKSLLLCQKYKKLQKYKLINIYTIVFYILNFIYYYPFISANTNILVMYDVVVALVLFIILIINKRSVYNE